MGMIDRGHRVTVYGEPPFTSTAVHALLDQCRGRYTLRYRPRIPESRLLRLIGAAWLIIRHGWRNPGLVGRSLLFLRYGRCSASFKLLYSAMPFLRRLAGHDVISCHFGDFGMLANALRTIGALEGPIITTFHGYDLSSYLAKAGAGVYRNLFKQGDFFLLVSEIGREKLISLGCRADKIAVHRMGIDLSRFSYKDRIRHSNSARVVTISRLVEKKGLSDGICAVAEVAKSRPGIRYKIVGDGPMRGDLLDLIGSLGLRGIVELCSWKSAEEVHRILAEADVYLAPSVTASDGDQEGIPVSLMEAMATGVRVVSTWHSGIPELVHDGVSGLLTHEGDVVALTEHLTALLDHPELRERISRAGRAAICQSHDIDDLNHKLESLFYEVASDGDILSRNGDRNRQLRDERVSSAMASPITIMQSKRITEVNAS
ncbi:MAG: glycosyltransferase [Bryobacteraceae bacterium]